MKMSLFILSITFTSLVFAQELVDGEKALEVKNKRASQLQKVCNAKLNFITKPNIKEQTLNLDDKTSLTIHQFLTTYSYQSAKVATNVICQQLTGAKYTGSNEEWAGVIKSAFDGFQAKGATDIEFIITNDAHRVYSSLVDNKEYDFKANFDGHMQLIKNLTVLDKKSNTAYTLSVSGSQNVESEIINEFTRLVQSFELTK